MFKRNLSHLLAAYKIFRCILTYFSLWYRKVKLNASHCVIQHSRYIRTIHMHYENTVEGQILYKHWIHSHRVVCNLKSPRPKGRFILLKYIYQGRDLWHIFTFSSSFYLQMHLYEPLPPRAVITGEGEAWSCVLKRRGEEKTLACSSHSSLL